MRSPDVSGFAIPVREQVTRAFEDARDNPHSASANGHLGMVLQAYEQFEGAETAYARAHASAPQAFEWLYYLALTESERANQAGTVRELRLALRLRPSDWRAELHLASALQSMGKLQESAALYHRVIQDQPERAEAHYGLGQVLQASGDRQGAAEAFRRACECFPAYAAAHYALSQVYRALGVAQRAREEADLYQQYGKAEPPEDDPLMAAVSDLNHAPAQLIRRGTALETAGDLRGAAHLHEEALAAEPNNVTAHVNLVTIYTKLGEFARAEEQYLIALALQPRHARLHNAYAALLLEQHRDAPARAELGKTLEIDPQYLEAHENLGFMAEREGHKVEALEHYRKALEIQPAFQPARFNAGRILLGLARYGEAQQEFLKMLTIARDRSRALAAIADLYLRLCKSDVTYRFVTEARRQAAAAGEEDVVSQIDQSFAVMLGPSCRP